VTSSFTPSHQARRELLRRSAGGTRDTSTDRIVATHVGSLPRPPDLLDAVEAREQGKPLGEKAHAGDAKIASKAVVGEAGCAKARVRSASRAAPMRRSATRDDGRHGAVKPAQNA
jgi:hypothetical protein